KHNLGLIIPYHYNTFPVLIPVQKRPSNNRFKAFYCITSPCSVSSRILVELNIILRLLTRKKHPPKLLKLGRTLLILIKHSEYISLYSFPWLSRSSTLHMLYQIINISHRIIHTSPWSSLRGPTTLRHHDFQRPSA
ncbi:unnamed protein product, partial [Brassica oleracea]